MGMTQEFIPLLQAKQCGPDTLTISPEHGSLWVAGKIGQDLDGKLEIEYDVASRVVRLRRTDKGTPSKTRGCMQLIRAFGLRSHRYYSSLTLHDDGWWYSDTIQE